MTPSLGTPGATSLYDRVRHVIPPFEWPAFADDIDAILDEGAAAIPRTILVLRKLAQIRRQASASGNKVGRNDPCPCGSGRRTASCAGLPSPERNIGQ